MPHLKDLIMESRYDYISVSLKENEVLVVRKFVSALKKRVGHEKRATTEEIINGFKRIGVFLERNDVERFCRQIQINSIVDFLIFDGDSMWISDNEKDMHQYINSMYEQMEQRKDKRHSQVIKEVCKSINMQIIKKKNV